MTNKRYQEIIKQWNPTMVVYITYKTEHSHGTMTMSIAFFIEKYKRLTRVFKGCEITDVAIVDTERGVVRKHFNSLGELFYAKGI